MPDALLLPVPATHDPGGKIRLALPPGMRGSATFCGPADCYRPMLRRAWGPEPTPYALWIGQNPSVAGATVNDPTVAREVAHTRRMGLTGYWKANVADYRATEPKSLQTATVPLCSPDNLAGIVDAALHAERVVLAFGALTWKPMRTLAEDMVAELRRLGRPLWCLGTTADGSPRHPLYVRSDAPLVEWRGWLASGEPW